MDWDVEFLFLFEKIMLYLSGGSGGGRGVMMG